MAMKPLSELLGGVTRFGRLSILGEADPYIWGGRRYRLALCKCACGATRKVQPAKLRSGQTLSCGCYAAEQASIGNRTHGLTGSPAYKSWQSMRNRCYRTSDSAYHNYGGRGVSVCERWRDSFEAFLEDMGPRPDGMTIDRIDNNGNYEPGNCRWATLREQADNTRATRHIEVDGERINMSEAARRSGLRQSSIRGRLNRGMTPAMAVKAPKDTTQGARRKSNNRHVEFQGLRMLMVEVSEVTGIEGSHLNYHLKRGKTADEAVALILERRKMDKGRCVNGHELAGDNLYVAPKGGKQCRICRSDATQRAREKRARLTFD